MKLNQIEQKIVLYSTWVITTILVLIPFHAFLSSWAGNNFGHQDLLKLWKEALILLIIPFIALLVVRRKELRQWVKSSTIIKLYGVYILVHLLLGAIALDNQSVSLVAFLYSLDINLRFIGFFILCVLIASQTKFFEKNWQKMVSVPATAVIIFGITQKFLPHDFLKYFYGSYTMPSYQTVDSNPNLARIQSTLRGANPFGAYLVLALSSLAVIVKSKITKSLIMAVGILTLFYTYSRSAWVGTLISFVLLSLWIVSKGHYRRIIILAIMTSLIITGGVFYVYKNDPNIQNTFLHTSQTSTSKVSSNRVRSTALEEGLRDIYHQPLGRGPGTAGPASSRNVYGARISENYFLQIGQEVGLVGLAIFGLISYLVIQELWKIRNKDLAKILLASFVGITFINLLSHAWTDDTLSLLWWGLAGIALAPSLIKGKNINNVNHGKS